MPVAGYSCKISAGVNASPVTNEPAALLSGSGTTKLYQVTLSTRQIWDPNTVVTVKSNAVTVSSTLYTFNYLTGKIQFAGFDPSGDPVTVDGTPMTAMEITTAFEFELTMKRILKEDTPFGVSYKRRKPLLRDFSGSFKVREDSIASGKDGQDYDTTAGELYLLKELFDGTPKLFEINMSTDTLRGWALIEAATKSAKIEDLIEDTHTFQGAPQPAGISRATYALISTNTP